MTQLVERNQLGQLPGAKDGEPMVPPEALALTGGITDTATQVVAGYKTAGPYVHVGEVYGAEVYLTKQTVWEAARLFLFVEPETADRLLADLEDVVAKNEVLTAELEEARSQQTRVIDADALQHFLTEHGLVGSGLAKQLQADQTQAVGKARA